MARKAKELSALAVGRLNTPGHYAVGGVTGLYLYVSATGARSWVLRAVIGEKRRHMGLGSFPDISLAVAHELARAARTTIAQGDDPIAIRTRSVAKAKAQQSSLTTFQQATEGYLDAHGDSWKNPKHRAQWESTLRTYVYPIMGDLAVGDVNQEHVLKALAPIWKVKNETASRVRGRIESVLDWATVRKLRTGDNPARWKGHLDKLLPAPSKVKNVEHHRALSFKEMPEFMSHLRNQEGIAARALEFAILCAARSGEVRGATWGEIDLVDNVWGIPAHRMKANREHRVPLSDRAVRLLEGLPRHAESPFVFTAPRAGQWHVHLGTHCGASTALRTSRRTDEAEFGSEVPAGPRHAGRHGGQTKCGASAW